MASILALFRILIFYFLFAIPLFSLSFLLTESIWAVLAFPFVALVFFFDVLTVDWFLKRRLKGRPAEIDGVRYRVFPEGSPHVLVTASFFSRTPLVWVSEGTLLSLNERELKSVLRSLTTHGRWMDLLADTLVCLSIDRVIRLIPQDQRKAVIGARSHARIRWTLWTLFIFGLISLFGKFMPNAWMEEDPKDLDLARAYLKCYRSSFAFLPWIPEAFMGLCWIEPWPKAILRYGRPCLVERGKVKDLT